MRNNIVLVLVLLSLIGINVSIYNKENLIASGEVVYIETVPRDPRSIIQGDYHILRYKIPSTITSLVPTLQRKGYLVLAINEKKIGALLRVYKEGVKLKKNERIILYRVRSRRIRLGAESFFFQEGHGQYYNNARYSELRLAKNGHSLLVALRDENLNKLAPPQ